MRRRDQQFDQVSGIFDSKRDLEDLMTALHQRGIDDENISLLMSEKTRNHYMAAFESNKVPEGASIGGLSGGLLGVIIGGLTMVGNVLIPGIGLFVAGPLIGALTGGAVGTAVGSLIGALVGAGIPEHEARFYEDALKREGNVLVVAHVLRDEAPEIKALFQRFGAHQVKVHH